VTQAIKCIPAIVAAEFLPREDYCTCGHRVAVARPPRDYQLGPDDILAFTLKASSHSTRRKRKPPAPPPVNFPQRKHPWPPSIDIPIRGSRPTEPRVNSPDRTLQVTTDTRTGARKKIPRNLHRERYPARRESEAIGTISGTTYDVIVSVRNRVRRPGEARVLRVSDRSATVVWNSNCLLQK